MHGDDRDLLAQRKSVRAFSDAKVDLETVQRICRSGRQAPSGANLQPGKFHVLTGQALADLKSRLAAAYAEGGPVDAEYSYFPPTMNAELKARQKKAGYALYEAMGIPRRDIAGRRQQFAKNYAFFDAPVGVVVTIDRDMGKGCFMDLGSAIMSFFLASLQEGLASTGIGALANYARVIHDHLGLAADEMVVCGIALGVADASAPVNAFSTERQLLEEYTTFRGFMDQGDAP
ncbi:MAG: nitroreductase [Gammaproteobacteria bacterium]|jgi:nitroreductase